MKKTILAALSLMSVVASAEDSLTWYAADRLPIEGAAFKDAPTPFSRLPKRAEKLVRAPLWAMSKDSTGLLVRFSTDADKIEIRWKVANDKIYDPYIPVAGQLGLDVYTLHPAYGWQYQQTLTYRSTDKAGKEQLGTASIKWRPNTAGLIYLPMRGETTDFRIGIPSKCKLVAFPHPADRQKPVVHYGTSIVHGGCASAHGLSFAAQVGRALDIPYVNLGFSGEGRMDLPMADLMTEIDAALYVVDCVWNLNEQTIAERTEPFLSRLVEKRPETPILLAEGPTCREQRLRTNDALYAVYARLKAADPKKWRNLYYICEEDLLTRGDYRQTHDFIHPNDFGYARMAEGFAKAEAKILGLKRYFVFPGTKVIPTARHIHYGPHPKQIFNFYRAPGAGIHPVFVIIHGGGWLGGDGVMDADLGRQDGVISQFLERGISVAVVNYRLGLKLPAPVYDAAYAIQYLRYHAREYGVDKESIAASGFSAGATTSLWLACHPDLADPKAKDPVKRESSRVNAAIARGVQASIDPPEVRAWGLARALEAHQMIMKAGGFNSVKEMDAGYEKVKDLYKEFSSSNFVGPDTPPVLVYGGKADSTDWIHHTLFAENFCRIAKEKGAKNVEFVEYGKPPRYRSECDFVAAVFGR